MLSGVLHPETDQELRTRLMYVAGDGQRDRIEIENAAGLALDEIAYRFNLKRRHRNGRTAR